MAVGTIMSHVARAKSFVSLAREMYFCLSKPTPWGTPDNPPVPSQDATVLTEPIGYRKVQRAYLVIPDENGELTDKTGNWKIVNVDDAFTSKARHVYIETTIDYSKMPVKEYRQVGIYSSIILVPDTSTTQYWYSPQEVSSTGVLELYENCTVSTRLVDESEVISVVVQL